ncbi:hypothetical protein [Fluviispira multicolorata]|uniref:Uncharacterized protein n=1 Tax=Fluviispira multicolorata TaxID=2654512 RepID=A0A833N525_9BACT|nr:hypothetical protein [Fluviispira multicolorata]KAB8029762.1 hypothetical protein GCL57_09475 [Fluviispira multicolorata]
MIILKSVHKNIFFLLKLSLFCGSILSTQEHSSMTYYSTLCGLINTTIQTTGPDLAKVYCSTADKKWAFLESGNVTVTGTWEIQKVRSLCRINFIIDRGKNDNLQLQNACKNEYGKTIFMLNLKTCA